MAAPASWASAADAACAIPAALIQCPNATLMKMEAKVLASGREA